MRLSKLHLFMALGLLTSTLHGDDNLILGRFSSQDLAGWHEQEFAGQTQYNFISVSGRVVLQAESYKSASAMYLKRKINIKQSPYLNWSWLNQVHLGHGHEKNKGGDDFAGRVYIVKEGGLFLWRTVSLNYVWANEPCRGESWNSPYAGKNVKLIAVQNSKTPLNVWQVEKHNVFEDIKRLYGREVDEIDGIAIMSDTDNSSSPHAVMLYGDIYFSDH